MMVRNLEILGLALAAMLAFGALSAAGASAQQGVLTSDGPVTLDATEFGEPGSGANAWTSFGNKFECPGSNYTGHKYNVTPHELIPSGATTTTITPHYNQANCRSTTEGGTVLSQTINMNGCDYVFQIGETASTNTYPVTKDVVCPGSAVIQVDSHTSSSHSIFNRVCRTTIGSQSGIEGVHASNEGGDLRMTGTFTGIAMSKSGLCGSGSSNEAELHIDVTIEGTNAAGQPTDISISD